MHVDHNQRQDHFLEADLVHSAQAADKMGWWIDVRSPLADVRVNLGEKSFANGTFAFLIPVGGFPFLFGKPVPMWDPGCESVGEVDKFFSGQDLLDLQKGGF